MVRLVESKTTLLLRFSCRESEISSFLLYRELVLHVRAAAGPNNRVFVNCLLV